MHPTTFGISQRSDGDAFEHVVEQLLGDRDVGERDKRTVRGRLALGKWDLGGLSVVKQYLEKTGSDDGEAALAKILRDGGAMYRKMVAQAKDAPPVNEREAVYDEVERERRREELRARAAHREYDSMVSDLRRSEIEAKNADTFVTYRQQMSVGMAAFSGLFTAVGLGYYLGRAIYGEKDGRAWTVALFFGIALLLVEMGLLIIHLSRADEYARRTAKKGS